MSEWTEEMAQQMRARAQLALSTALTTTDCMCAMCIKARTELLLLDDHDRLQEENARLTEALIEQRTIGHGEGQEHATAEWQAALTDRDATIARLRSLLEQALNGWSAFAKRKIELADISRIHAALTPATEADRE